MVHLHVGTFETVGRLRTQLTVVKKAYKIQLLVGGYIVAHFKEHSQLARVLLIVWLS